MTYFLPFQRDLFLKNKVRQFGLGKNGIKAAFMGK